MSQQIRVCGLVVMLVVPLLMIVPILEQNRAAFTTAKLSYLPKGRYLRLAVLGYREVTADLLWVEVLNHFGVRHQTQEGFQWTYHAVDVLTDLDPKFLYAYQATGAVLAVWAKQVPESIALLKKGVANLPDAWILPFLLGYDYYFELHDAPTAAGYFRQAASLPGSPAYLPELASRMTVQGGDPDAALAFLKGLYDQASDERTREGLLRHLRAVTVERDLRVLEAAIQAYHHRMGHLPARLEALVESELLPQMPDEPFGGVYRLHPDGTVSSSTMPERLHVFQRGG